MRIAAQHLDQMRKRLDRSIENVAADALVDCFAVPVKRDSQGGKRCRKAGAIAFADRSSRSNEKRSVQPAICDAVGSLESPAGKDRLHDLETVRGPSDRSGDLGQAHPRCRLAFEAEHDFRLDPRLRQMHHTDPVAGTIECTVVS